MKLTKGKLLNIVNENLNEMPMSFSSADRPSPELRDKLAAKQTPHSKVPYPSTGNEPLQNFQELLASERYKQVVERVKEYTGFNADISGSEPGTALPLLQMMMTAHNAIFEIESSHEEELEQLAVELVRSELGIGEDEIAYQAHLVSVGDIDTSDFRRERDEQPNQDDAEEEDDEEEEDDYEDEENDDEGDDDGEAGEPNPNNDEPENDEEPEQDVNPQQPQENQPNDELVDLEKELYTRLETINLEKAKRRLVNSLVQGGSKRGHYMYHLVADKLRQITGSDDIIGLYGILMSVNDIMYWQFDEATLNATGDDGRNGPANQQQPPQGQQQPPQGQQQGQRPKRKNKFGAGVAGKVSTDIHSETPTVIAQGVNFPVLVHELVKGTYSLIASARGRSSDIDIASKVEASEDTMEKEIWDLRLGPPIWDRMREQIPAHLFTQDNAKTIQIILFQRIIEKPAKEFLVFMKEVLSGSDRGKRLMELLVQSIEQELNDYDANEALGQFDAEMEQASDDITDDDLGDILGDFGIRLPDDD